MKKKKIILLVLCFFSVVICTILFEIFFGRGIPYVSKQKLWSIGIYKGDTPFNLYEHEGNPVLTASDVIDVPAVFIADPFMIEKDNIWFMFFEVWNAKTQQGDIGYAVSKDLALWKYQKIILDEDFHLSYPYIFEWEDDVFMVPESSDINEVRLYKATDFPTKWSFEKILINKKLIDSSLFHYSDLWWLYSNSKQDGIDKLHLYYAKDLNNTWIEHPKSPIKTIEPKLARPGGRVLVIGEKILRYNQYNYYFYGDRILAFKISDLTMTTYKEHEIMGNPIIKPSGEGWNKDGMHHIDLHKLNEKVWIACVDGYKKSWILSPLLKELIK